MPKAMMVKYLIGKASGPSLIWLQEACFQFVHPHCNVCCGSPGFHVGIGLGSIVHSAPLASPIFALMMNGSPRFVNSTMICVQGFWMAV